MSLVDVRAYIRARMDGLGHKEWEDGFNFDNIPSNLLNKSYHMEVLPIDAEQTNNRSMEFSYPMTVRLFVKGYRTPAAAIDKAIEYGETAIKDIVNAVNRSTNACIKNVLSGGLNVIPLSDSNDNSVVLEMSFVTTIIIEI